LERLEASHGTERCIIVSGGVNDNTDALLARLGIVATAADLVVRVRALLGIVKPEGMTINGVVVARIGG
jgi:hypothetical protein